MSLKIAIDKTSHAVFVLAQLDEMKNAKELCDFVIKVGCEEILAHRVLLSAVSDYFKAMLSHDMKEKQSGIVEMVDVDFECVKICVDYIYGREVEIPVNKYEDLLYASNMMQLKELCDYIYAKLAETLDSELFFTARRIANMHECIMLKEKCSEFAKENLLSLSKQDGFKDLDMGYIHENLTAVNVNMTEEEKLDIVLRFVKVSKDHRDHLEEMLKWVNLGEVPFENRKRLIKCNRLTKCKKIFKSLVGNSEEHIKKATHTEMHSSDGKIGSGIDIDEKSQASFLHQATFADSTQNGSNQTKESVCVKTKWTSSPSDSSLHQFINKDRPTRNLYDAKVSSANASFSPFCGTSTHTCIGATSASTSGRVGDKILPSRLHDTPTPIIRNAHSFTQNRRMGTSANRYEARPNGQRIVLLEEISKQFITLNPAHDRVAEIKEMLDELKTFSYSATAYNDYMCIFMQQDQTFHRFRYSDSASPWEKMPDMICNHGHSPPMSASQECIFVGGGSGPIRTSDFEKFDLKVWKWEKLVDKRQASADSVVLASNGYVYCVGGRDENRMILNIVERFNIALSTWTELAPMRYARWGAAAVEADRSIFVLGGWNRGSLDHVESYCIASNQWTDMKPMNIARWLFKAFTIDGSIYSVGGRNSSAAVGSIEKYQAEKWEMIELPSYSENGKIKIYDSVVIRV